MEEGGLKCDACSGSGGSVPGSHLRAFDDAWWVGAGGDGGACRGLGGKEYYTFGGLEGFTELGSYLGASKVKLWYSVCLQWPNIRLISLHTHLFTHHPPLFSQ